MGKIRRGLGNGLRVGLRIVEGGIVCAVLLLSLPVLWGVKPYMVMSGSMEPTLPIGALVYVEKTEVIEEGEIIAFDVGNGQICVHRCVEIKEDGTFVTKGDANTVEDVTSITRSQIIGKSVYVLPFAGFLVQFLQMPLGILFIGVCLLGNLVLRMMIGTEMNSN